jgi:hypothetical protein
MTTQKRRGTKKGEPHTVWSSQQTDIQEIIKPPRMGTERRRSGGQGKSNAAAGMDFTPCAVCHLLSIRFSSFFCLPNTPLLSLKICPWPLAPPQICTGDEEGLPAVRDRIFFINIYSLFLIKQVEVDFCFSCLKIKREH